MSAICSFHQCERPICARGLCNSHYAQQKKGNPLHAIGERFVPRAVKQHQTLPGVSVVTLTHGKVALIDTADAESVGEYNWSWKRPKKANVEYAVTNLGTGPGRRWCSLHRFLWERWGLPYTPQIDHKNTDGLDCRRENMRAATSSQNRCNTGARRDNAIGVKGVSWAKKMNKWRAQIGHAGKIIHIGYFDDIPSAKSAVEARRQELHGEFARAA